MMAVEQDQFGSVVDEIELARRARSRAEASIERSEETLRVMQPVWDRLFTTTHPDRFGQDFQTAMTLRPRRQQ